MHYFIYQKIDTYTSIWSYMKENKTLYIMCINKLYQHSIKNIITFTKSLLLHPSRNSVMIRVIKRELYTQITLYLQLYTESPHILSIHVICHGEILCFILHLRWSQSNGWNEKGVGDTCVGVLGLCDVVVLSAPAFIYFMDSVAYLFGCTNKEFHILYILQMSVWDHTKEEVLSQIRISMQVFKVNLTAF